MITDNIGDLDHWVNLIREWKESNLTQEEFCRNRQVRLSEFRVYKQLIPIHHLLESLPSEKDGTFAFKARQITANIENPIIKYEKILDNPVFPEKTRFNALYCLLGYLWQISEFQKYRQVIDKYEDDFENHVMLLTFRSQYYSCKEKNISNLRMALNYASKAKEEASNLPNVLHLFTRVVIEICDLDGNKVEKELLIEAERCINKAIAIVDGKYARYFATKADLLSKIGRYSEAKNLIQKAIEIEPSGRDDYALRIGDYQQIRLRIEFLEHSHSLELKQKESIEMLDEVRLRVIELLGLLAAVIAFLSTSIQIGQGFTYNEAARLMVVSGGIILIIFSSYSIIFFRSKLRLSQLTIFLLGWVIIAISYFLPELIQLFR